ncbi:MAG: SH3 domain-containing protein [Anaerolineae bacterium]
MIRRFRPAWIAVFALVVLAAALPAGAQGVTQREPFEQDGRVSPAYPLNVAPPRPVLTPPETIPTNLNEAAYLIVNTDNLFVRQGPAPEYAQVAIVDGGTSLIPLGWNGNTQNVWWYVQVGGMRGWVRGDFLYLRGNASDIPIVSSTEGQHAIPRLYVGSENFLRTAPTFDRNYICLIPGNLEYEIIGRTSDTTWYEISATCDTGAQVEGWITAESGLFRNPGDEYIPVTWFY